MQRVRGVGVGQMIEGAEDQYRPWPATGKTRTETREGTQDVRYTSP